MNDRCNKWQVEGNYERVDFLDAFPFVVCCLALSLDIEEPLFYQLDDSFENLIRLPSLDNLSFFMSPFQVIIRELSRVISFRRERLNQFK